MRRYVGNLQPLFTPPLQGESNSGCYPHRTSPYFIWWECLRRNKNYKKFYEHGFCDTGDAEKLSTIAEDFGDIWSLPFEEWWTTPLYSNSEGKSCIRGEYLFAEPEVPQIQRLSKEQALSFIETWDQSNYMLFAIPVAMYSEDFRIQSNVIFGDRYELKQQQRPSTRARYQFNGRIRNEPLNQALAIFDSVEAQPETERWVHAMRFDPAYAGVSESELRGARHLSERQELSRKGSRLLSRAKEMIEAVEFGLFPNKPRNRNYTRRNHTNLNKGNDE